MQIRKPRKEAISPGSRVAQVYAGVWIEQSLDASFTMLQYNGVRLVCLLWLNYT
jgi:hypothetical protein